MNHECAGEMCPDHGGHHHENLIQVQTLHEHIGRCACGSTVIHVEHMQANPNFQAINDQFFNEFIREELKKKDDKKVKEAA